MKIRLALTALVVIGMFGFTANTVEAQCRYKEKAKTGCSADKAKAGCKAQSEKTSCKASQCKHQCSAECKKAGCQHHGRAGCSADCKNACSASKMCNYTEEECARKIREHYQTRGWLGIEMSMEASQPVVTGVTERSPAEAAGFQSGDVLTSLNGIPYGQGNDAVLAEMTKNGFEVGDTVVYTVNRDGHIHTLRATLSRISEQGLARMIEFHHANVKHKPRDRAARTDK